MTRSETTGSLTLCALPRFPVIATLTTRSCVVPCSNELAQNEPLSQIWASLTGPERASVPEKARCTTPNEPVHLLPPPTLQVSPPTVPMVSSHRRVTEAGPAPGLRVKKFAPVDSQSPVAASCVSGLVTPLTVASTFAPTRAGSPPKSTAARTPMVHNELAEEKYGSVHASRRRLGRRVTLRARGGFGCAPLPALDQPRA